MRFPRGKAKGVNVPAVNIMAMDHGDGAPEPFTDAFSDAFSKASTS